MTDSDKQLRILCLDKAITAGGTDVLKNAQEPHAPVTAGKTEIPSETKTLPLTLPVMVRDWKAESLTTSQKIVLKQVIKWWREDESISGGSGSV